MPTTGTVFAKKKLYDHTEWYGGVFDEARDGRERLNGVIQHDPEAILVYEEDAALRARYRSSKMGAWLCFYRFVVPTEKVAIAKELYDAAVANFKARGHDQILVYSSPDNAGLDARYTSLGMKRGGNYVCFWADI